MLINSCDKTSFGVNINSRKLRFSPKDFFIRIPGYGRNIFWAYRTIRTTNDAVDLIRNGTDAENVLKFITAGISKANQFCHEPYKRKNSGLLRTLRDGWKNDPNINTGLITGYGKTSRYKVYDERFNRTYAHPLKNPIKITKIKLTRPSSNKKLIHGSAKYINNALDYIFQLSKGIFPKFIQNEVSQKDMSAINGIIAEIRWVMAHSTPWARGSDAISNVYMRAMYKALGIKTYPLKQGVSLDLEAYCTQLSKYKTRFATYFEKPPEIIE